jgi:ergothioneine biosynthesis protein EgtB
VDAAVVRFLESDPSPEEMAVIEVGLQHEQQHQELMLMDIKHVLGTNPLRPEYRTVPRLRSDRERSSEWLSFGGGQHEIGWASESFAFDNERPRHTVYLEPFELASRPVTNREFLSFIEEGGYQRPEVWLADGWDLAHREGWQHPLYWEKVGSTWMHYGLDGHQELDLDEPLCHVTYYEADAFARFRDARLPTEAEWEVASESVELAGRFAEEGVLHPRPAPAGKGLLQMFGDVWEYTSSPYAPYPGFRPLAGALGEYNGKFMCNQLVVRGGACVTPGDHVRRTYRNFFYPGMRWQFVGIRLAR